MSRMDGLRQTETPLDQFLYAELGNDSAGNTVSVLSALARLGLDPWAEAVELSAMTQDGARQHLRLLLARLHDVPELDHDRDLIIARLVQVLPKAARGRTYQAAGARFNLGELGPIPIVVALLVILILAQSLFFGLGNAGD